MILHPLMKILRKKKVDSNDSQTIVNSEIVPSPSDLNITPSHVMSRIPDIHRRSQGKFVS